MGGGATIPNRCACGGALTPTLSQRERGGGISQRERGSKRRRTLAVLCALLLALLIVPATASAAPQPPYFQSFDVEIDIRPNGDFWVTENQTVRFGPSTARRGFREIPLDRVEQITDVTVSEPGSQYRRAGSTSGLQVSRQGDSLQVSLQTGRSAQETPFTYQAERQEGFLRIEWWFPPTSNASRTFLVRYRVVGGLRYYPGGDQLFWKAIYEERSLPIESARVVVRLPADLTPDQLRMAAYPEGLGFTGELVDPHTVEFDGRGLPEETGLEVRVQFPHGLVSGQAPSWQAEVDRAEWYNENLRPVLNFFLGVGGLLILLVGSLWVFTSWYSRGRDPDVGEVPQTLSEPPDDLAPAVAGTLLDESADVQDAVATLVDLAHRGVIRIVEEQRARAGRWRHDFRLELLQESPEGLRDYERTILDSLFARDRTVRFSQVGERFQRAIPAVQQQLYDEVVRRGLFPRSPEAVRSRQEALNNAGLDLTAKGREAIAAAQRTREALWAEIEQETSQAQAQAEARLSEVRRRIATETEQHLAAATADAWARMQKRTETAAKSGSETRNRMSKAVAPPEPLEMEQVAAWRPSDAPGGQLQPPVGPMLSADRRTREAQAARLAVGRAQLTQQAYDGVARAVLRIGGLHNWDIQLPPDEPIAGSDMTEQVRPELRRMFHPERSQ